MKPRNLQTLHLIVAALFLSVPFAGAQEESTRDKKGHSGEISGPPASPEHAKLTGHLVCLVEAMHQSYGTELQRDHQHILGFKTTEGECYTVLRTKLSEALFADERLRDRKLLLSVRILPRSHVLDVITIKSIKDGVVHDLYYYCFICAIRTVSGGPCMCCQEEMEFQEKPLEP